MCHQKKFWWYLPPFYNCVKSSELDILKDFACILLLAAPSASLLSPDEICKRYDRDEDGLLATVPFSRVRRGVEKGRLQNISDGSLVDAGAVHSTNASNVCIRVTESLRSSIGWKCFFCVDGAKNVPNKR
jgi:hypothetical protein